jgi:pentapeptide MXKDX repeat protein
MLKNLLICFLILGLYQCAKKMKVSSLSRSLQENISTLNNTSMMNNTMLNDSMRNDYMRNFSMRNDSMRNDSMMPTNLTSAEYCPKKNNCLFYGVEDNLERYDCLVCKKENMLVYDNKAIASCEEKNTIQNCEKSMKRSDRNKGNPFCFRCDKDYALKGETECLKIPNDKKIDNCRDYEFKNNNYTCLNCEQNFKLDEKNNKCEKGCNIEGCETCKMVNNQEFCLHCLPNMIGIFDGKSDSFKSCMTCDQYKFKLKISNSTYIPSSKIAFHWIF